MSYSSFRDWIPTFKGQIYNAPGCSRLERLPNEILDEILRHTAISEVDECPDANTPSSSLYPCLLTSRRLYDAVLPTRYQGPNIRSLDRFIEILKNRPEYARFVSSLRLATRKGETAPKDLVALLRMTPNVRRISFHIDALRDSEQAITVLDALHGLESVAVHGALAEQSHANLFSQPDFANMKTDISYRMTSLSLHDLPNDQFLRAILPNAPLLRSLVVEKCLLDESTLSTLNTSASLTDLSLEGCSISHDEVVEFLSHHSAVKDSLEKLNLRDLHSSQDQFLSKDHVSTILDSLSSSIRSLDLGGSAMSRSHISMLRDLSSRIHNLSVGSHLNLQDIEETILENHYEFLQHVAKAPTSKEITANATLATLAHRVAVIQFNQRLQSLKPKQASKTKSKLSSIRRLDLRSMYVDIDDLRQCVLLGPQSLPLRTIELPEIIMSSHSEMPQFCAAVGWECMWVGSRIWLERV